jgi:hypothetical protein
VDNRIDPISAFAFELLAYVEGVAAASEPPGAAFSFGPLHVDIRVVGEDFRRRLTRAIDFARVTGPVPGRSPWRITALDGAAAGIAAPPDWTFRVTSPRHLERLHHSDDQQLCVRYNPSTSTWSAVFFPQRAVVIWTADARQLPDWDDSAPFRDMFHWMLLHTEFFLAHAATVGVDGKGILLTGRGGSGKSTTAAAAALGGMVTTGDDFVLIDPQSTCAHALYDCVKLDQQSAGWLPQLSAHAVNAGRDPGVKYRIHLAENFRSAFTDYLPINAVLLPRIEGSAKTEITPATIGEAMRALVPSTICLIRGGESETIRKATSFLRQIRAYNCLLGSDPREAVDAISKFVAALPR